MAIQKVQTPTMALTGTNTKPKRKREDEDGKATTTSLQPPHAAGLQLFSGQKASNSITILRKHDQWAAHFDANIRASTSPHLLFLAAAPAATPAGASPDQEAGKRFVMNALGTVMTATTSDSNELPETVQEVFQKAQVALAAMTAAAGKAGVSIYDSDAIEKAINASGLFIDMGKENKKLHVESQSLSIDTQMISQLIGSAEEGSSSMKAAKSVMNKIGTFTASHENETSMSQVGSLLFILEDIFGMPNVSLKLFTSKKEQASTIYKTNCAKAATKSLDLEVAACSWMFVDPSYIKKFSGELVGATSDPAFKELEKNFLDSFNPPTETPAAASDTPAPAETPAAG